MKQWFTLSRLGEVATATVLQCLFSLVTIALYNNSFPLLEDIRLLFLNIMLLVAVTVLVVFLREHRRGKKQDDWKHLVASACGSLAFAFGSGMILPVFVTAWSGNGVMALPELGEITYLFGPLVFFLLNTASAIFIFRFPVKRYLAVSLVVLFLLSSPLFFLSVAILNFLTNIFFGIAMF